MMSIKSWHSGVTTGKAQSEHKISASPQKPTSARRPKQARPAQGKRPAWGLSSTGAGTYPDSTARAHAGSAWCDLNRIRGGAGVDDRSLDLDRSQSRGAGALATSTPESTR